MISWTGSKNNIETVALIGNGTMGRCMLEALINAKYKVVVYDPFPSAQEHAEKVGATVVDSPKAAAEAATLILLSLPAAPHIREAMTGENGIVEGLTSDHLVVDTSTVDPQNTRDMAEKAAEKGALYVDAPILGRPSAVGKWLLPVGGDAAAIKWAEPALLTFAGTVKPVGELGSGNALKLLNQMMFATINAISSEVMAICDHVGIEKDVFFDTVANSGAATVSGLFKEVGSNIVNDNFNQPTFTVDLLIKDLGLGLQMSKEHDAPSVIGSIVQIYNELATSSGLGSQDTSALYKVFSRNYRKEQ